MASFTHHPLRDQLDREMHARPHAVITAPAQVTRIAAITGEEAGAEDREHIRDLCTAFKVSPPPSDATEFEADCGPFRIAWERHTEFSTYTLIKEGGFATPFKEPASLQVPADWLAGIPGEVTTACHIAIEAKARAQRKVADLSGLFDHNAIVGGHVVGGRALLCSDYRQHTDGFLRFLLTAVDLSPDALGRVVQRLCEMETYRMTALLSLPLARAARPDIAALEQQLSVILQELAVAAGTPDEQALLKRMSAVAAETERISASLNYRFNASRAYQEIVRQRARGLRLERVAGLQPLTDYVLSRFEPAMETCENLMRRIETLSGRISRASDLLRTRVDVAVEAQNQDLLQSMNRRARLQLRLQQTVEGLSIVAISYYLVGLIQYLLKGAKAAGYMPFDVATVTALLLVPVVLLIWFLSSRIRHRIAQAHRKDKPEDSASG